MSNYITKSAVLFLVFNRPDTTERVFETIRMAMPPRLYIASDGARKHKVGEEEKVKTVRDIVSNIDWECQVKTLYRGENLGCGKAVSTAITWFFEHEEQGIILEDDCLPHIDFFRFCDEMLDSYKFNENIMAITGTNITKGISYNDSFFFSQYALMWGWATWSVSWEKYDYNMKKWPLFYKQMGLNKLRLGGVPFLEYWKVILHKTYIHEIDTWDFQWIFACWYNQGLTIAPKVNLVKNIGFSMDATHTTGYHPVLSELVNFELEFPLNYPSNININRRADKLISKFWFNISWQNYIKSSLLKIAAIKRINDLRKIYFS